jgi:hypothetical protein
MLSLRQVKTRKNLSHEGVSTMYEKPVLKREGTVREITLAGGCTAMADGVNPYHRYNPEGATCGFPNG